MTVIIDTSRPTESGDRPRLRRCRIDRLTKTVRAEWFLLARGMPRLDRITVDVTPHRWSVMRPPPRRSCPSRSLPALSAAGPLDTETVHEDALLRHGGPGATRSTTRLTCGCGWALVTDTTETRPPRTTPWT